MSLNLNKKDGPAARLVLSWLNSLAERDKGGRAALRRAASLHDALMSPSVHRLRRQLDELSPGELSEGYRSDRLAMACALMSHLKQPGNESLPEAMSHRQSGGDRNAVSELRFRRLLEAHDDEALFTALRRVLPLVDGLVCPVQLTNDVLFWGDKVKRQWAYSYRWPERA